jgi:hypothetical protein
MQSVDANNWMLARKNIRNDEGVEIAPTESNHNACREFLVQYGHVVPGAAEISRDLYAMSLFELRNTLSAVQPAPEKQAPRQDQFGAWESNSRVARDAADHDSKVDAAKSLVAEAKRRQEIMAFRNEKEPVIYYPNSNRIDHVSTTHAVEQWNQRREARRVQLFAEREDEQQVVYTTGPNQRINWAATDRAREAARQKNKENGL